MHLIVTETQAPFEPEAGAYGDHGQPASAHGHSHSHPHDHGDHSH